MSADQLFKLPNGTWLRPSSVIAIIPAEAHTGMSADGQFKHHEPIKPRVIVRYLGDPDNPDRHQCEIIYCDTFEAAKTLADEIAAQVGAEDSK